MCSKPIVQAVTKPFVDAGNAVGSAFERNVSAPIKTAADNTGAWFEDKISANVKKAADDTSKAVNKAATDTATWFESNISAPTKTFYDNRNNWFSKPGMPGLPEDTGSQGGPGPMATDVGLTDVLGRKRRARQSAMRFGIMSTIGKGNATGGPTLSTPTATAPKTLLGL